MKGKKIGLPPKPKEAGPMGCEERKAASAAPAICRYCGGVIKLVPAQEVYGESTERLGMTGQYLYQCQNCNARVGCHRDSTRALGNVANEVLRLKRMETHRIFDALWKRRNMSRRSAYRWLAGALHLPESRAHIGGFEMDQCQKVIELCEKYENEEVA